VRFVMATFIIRFLRHFFNRGIAYESCYSAFRAIVEISPITVDLQFEFIYRGHR
jgi:hypothetical protein